MDDENEYVRRDLDVRSPVWRLESSRFDKQEISEYDPGILRKTLLTDFVRDVCVHIAMLRAQTDDEFQAACDIDSISQASLEAGNEVFPGCLVVGNMEEEHNVEGKDIIKIRLNHPYMTMPAAQSEWSVELSPPIPRKSSKRKQKAHRYDQVRFRHRLHMMKSEPALYSDNEHHDRSHFSFSDLFVYVAARNTMQRDRTALQRTFEFVYSGSNRASAASNDASDTLLDASETFSNAPGSDSGSFNGSGKDVNTPGNGVITANISGACYQPAPPPEGKARGDESTEKGIGQEQENETTEEDYNSQEKKPGNEVVKPEGANGTTDAVAAAASSLVGLTTQREEETVAKGDVGLQQGGGEAGDQDISKVDSAELSDLYRKVNEKLEKSRAEGKKYKELFVQSMEENRELKTRVRLLEDIMEMKSQRSRSDELLELLMLKEGSGPWGQIGKHQHWDMSMKDLEKRSQELGNKVQHLLTRMPKHAEAYGEAIDDNQRISDILEEKELECEKGKAEYKELHEKWNKAQETIKKQRADITRLKQQTQSMDTITKMRDELAQRERKVTEDEGGFRGKAQRLEEDRKAEDKRQREAREAEAKRKKEADQAYEAKEKELGEREAKIQRRKGGLDKQEETARDLLDNADQVKKGQLEREKRLEAERQLLADEKLKVKKEQDEREKELAAKRFDQEKLLKAEKRSVDAEQLMIWNEHAKQQREFERKQDQAEKLLEVSRRFLNAERVNMMNGYTQRRMALEQAHLHQAEVLRAERQSLATERHALGIEANRIRDAEKDRIERERQLDEKRQRFEEEKAGLRKKQAEPVPQAHKETQT